MYVPQTDLGDTMECERSQSPKDKWFPLFEVPRVVKLSRQKVERRLPGTGADGNCGFNGHRVAI